MVLRLSRNRLYQAAAVAALPVAAYNLVVWFSNPDTKWEQQYLRSLIGGLSLIVLAIVLLVLSYTRPNRTITLCENQHLPGS